MDYGYSAGIRVWCSNHFPALAVDIEDIKALRDAQGLIAVSLSGYGF